LIAIIGLWVSLLLIFVGVPSFYYLYLRKVSSRSWNLKIDPEYSPPATIIIPTHNEEKTIRLKLENLSKVNYPKEKMQIIIVDDASSDKTVEEATSFASNNNTLNIRILNQSVRSGKSNSLNIALKQAENDVIVMSDADAFWDPNILREALPYLADSSVGAVIGKQKILNSDNSWITQAEEQYLNFAFDVIRLGESKIHSTIIFHGSFAAYKKELLTEFNVETDDSGTALDIVQKGARTILAHNAICFDISPTTLKGLVSAKIRRASQLVQVWVKCFKLLVKGKLQLPKRIIIPEVFMYVVNPIIFFLLIITSIFVLFIYFPYSIILPLILFSAVLNPKIRLLLIEFIQSNCILLIALFSCILGKKFIAWNPLEESRSILTRKLLEDKNLI
jgi:cellulose synthase/poly-beta-1,6-N-acetylglucosamine synthase-like glycosyltransferase